MFDGPGVYAIVNRVNDKMYIGSSTNMARRWIKHRHELRKGTHHNRPLLRAFAKYGTAFFSFELVEHVEDPAQLIAREQTWIDLFKPAYNTCQKAGTALGVKRSDATRKKLSDALKGNCNGKRVPFSDEHRAKLSKAATGRTYSEETRAKMRVAKLGKKQSPELVAKRMAAIAKARAAKKAIQ